MRFADPTCPLSFMYRENQPWLRAWLTSRVGCSETAADLAQDTFLRLLKSDRRPPTGHSRRYLTQVAKGLMIDDYRRKTIEQAYLARLRAMPESFAPDPEAHHAVIEALLEIDKMLKGLPEKVQNALLLRQLEGLSYGEIAARLSVSVSSVEKYVARGLAACCRALES